ncbi:MAG: TRAP transporter small permease [Treponema sp.]|jgi:TRAP-type C4-dicarboxylate transport system permease small subunit|nr:TRAP transporter small permease [Treponema sp.]
MSGKLKNYLEKGIDGIAVLFFAAVFILVLAQILMRWLFKNPIVWSEELIRLMYVWICFIGWTLASRYRTHIKITFIIDALPPVPQKLLASVNNLLLLLFSVFMVYYGIKMTAIGSHGRAVSLPLNFALVYVIAPAANLIIILYHLTDMAVIWKKPKGAE